MSDGWRIVRTVGTDEDATLITGFLGANGIPTQIESLLFHQEPVTFGALGEVRIRVPADLLEEAHRLLEEADLSVGAGDGTAAAEVDGE